MDVQGKVAIVTGSATGIGRATALALAELGCHVVINYTRSATEARDTVAAVEQRGVETLLVQADVSSDAACRALVAQTLARWGRLDALVNNAGATSFVPHADLEALTEDIWDRTLAVNVKGTFFMTRAAAPALRASGQGAVVNVASVGALRGTGRSIAYAAAKAAVVNMTQSLARALGPQLRVNCVAPAFVDGRWMAAGLGDQYEAARAANRQATALKDVGRPEHMAQAVVSLITGMDWVTGQAVLVDGGYHLGV